MIIEIINLFQRKKQDGELPSKINVSLSADRVLCREMELYNNPPFKAETCVGGRLFGLFICYDSDLDSVNGWTIT